MRHAIFFIIKNQTDGGYFSLLSIIPSENYFKERFPTMLSRRIGDTHLFYGQSNSDDDKHDNEVLWTLPDWGTTVHDHVTFWDGKYYSNEGFVCKISTFFEEKYPSV